MTGKAFGRIVLMVQITLLVLLAVPVLTNAYMPFYRVQTGSMLPVYPIGSFVLVHNYQPKHMHDWVGKAVVFFDPSLNSVIVHRVIGLDRNFLVTKGDNNAMPDVYKPTPKDVLGLVYACL